MPEQECFENYPKATVIIANLVPLLVWLIGAYILSRFGILLAVAYIIVVLALEYRLMSSHCTDCYYYGKTCAFGKGRLSFLFFRRGSPEKFVQMKIGWRDLVPDFLVFLVPVLAGIVLLVLQFSESILLLVIILLLLGFAGNAFVRGQLACRFCKQREIGCPAEKMFGKRSS